MSKAASSLCRRLWGIIATKPTSIATSKLTSTASTKPTSTARVKPTNATPSTPATKLSGDKECKLEKFVQKFKESSESSRFRKRHSHYAATVRRLASVQKFSMVEDILEHQKKFDDITSENFVIRLMLLYSYAGMFDHAHKLFDEMPQLKCERTVRSFNALLSTCVNAKKFDKVEEILRELPGKLGINPNLVSYNTVIKAYCEMGSLDNALSVLDELEKNELEPDLITFNTILEAFYKNGRYSEGDEVWGLMESKYVVPDIRSYNSKLRGLIHDKGILEAVKLVDELGSKGLKPDLYTYNALIAGSRNDGNLEEAKKWYSELIKNGYSPDKVTYLMLVPFLCEKGDLDMALELCREAINWRVNCPPATFKLMIDELVKESRVEEAIELLKLGNLKSYFRYNLNLPLGK